MPLTEINVDVIPEELQPNVDDIDDDEEDEDFEEDEFD